MTTEPIEGQRYRVTGTDPTLRHARGQIGVASGVERVASSWSVTISDLASWGSVRAMSYEIEPAPELQAPVLSTSAYEGGERELVADIITALVERGYLVCVVGQKRAKGSGTTVGYPDLSVRRKAWPDGMACLLEVKTAGGELSGEQEDLLKMGWSYLVRSIEGAISSLTRFEAAIGSILRDEVFAK